MTDIRRSRKADALAAMLLAAMLLAAGAARAQTADGGAAEAILSLPEAEGGLFELLQTGDGIVTSVPAGESNVISIPLGAPEDRIAIYRTLCVRLCDGYYFPMSPSSSRNDFARDQQNCESICPAAETRVYYQPSGDADAGTMLSGAADDPYPELANAYLYKQPDAPERSACGCGRTSADGYALFGGGGAAIPQSPAGSIVYVGPAAEAAPPAAEDESAGAPPLRQTDERPSGKRKVRVVGPGYLPGRAAAGVPPGPAPTTGR